MLKTYYSVNDNILLDAETARSIAVALVVCMAHDVCSTNVYPEKCLNLCYASTFSPFGFFEAKGICTCEFLSRIYSVFYRGMVGPVFSAACLLA